MERHTCLTPLSNAGSASRREAMLVVLIIVLEVIVLILIIIVIVVTIMVTVAVLLAIVISTNGNNSRLQNHLLIHDMLKT